MPTPAQSRCNQTIDALPGAVMAEPNFVYRESPWIALPIRAVLAASGLGLVFLLVRNFLSVPLVFNSLFVTGAGVLVFGAIFLSTSDSINFICTRGGLYFPGFARFSRSPGRWLFVPWKNILEYRVQRMLDETSSRGIVLVILASQDDEKEFLSGHRIFNLSALRDQHAGNAARIGFSTFRPSPEAVLVQLQTYEAMPGSADQPERLELNRAT